MIKIAVLYLALYSSKVPFEGIRKLSKLCIVSGIGTVVEIVGLLYSVSYSVFLVCVNFLEVPIMVLILLGKERRKVLQVIAWGYFFLVLINGVLEMLWNQFGEVGFYIIFLLFSCGVVIVGTRMWKNYSKMQKGIFQVELFSEGHQARIKGFYDSGNHLKDLYTGKGVHIISEKTLEKLRMEREKRTDKVVYIPYKALGNEEGILEVYYIDELIILGEKGRRIIQNCPLGVTKDNLFEGKNYEIILNEEVF